MKNLFLKSIVLFSLVGVQFAFAEPNTLQAKCIPNLQGGQLGYRCINIKKGSAYQKLGLKNGDIIIGINGQEIQKSDETFDLLKELKPSKRANLQIVRNGKRKILIQRFESD